MTSAKVTSAKVTRSSTRSHPFTHLPLNLVILSWLSLFLLGCEGATVATPIPTTITITGATAMQPVLLDLTTEFGRQHPQVRFDLRGTGSSVGEERVAVGQVDLAASTLLPAALLTTTISPTTDLNHVPIGLDGLAIVVHPTNMITDLTVVQLAALFSGEILDWAELGSESGEVLLVSREDGSGSRLLFERRVMGEEQVSLTAVVMPSSADVVEYVGKNPQAIGYVSRAYVAASLPDGVETAQADVEKERVRVVSVEGQLPSLEAIKNQRYFLTQPLFLISRGQPQGEVRAFLDFVLSPAGQSIVGRYHVPVR